jgi:hypothetical protein
MVQPVRSRYALAFLTISILASMWACVQPSVNRQDPVLKSRATLSSRPVLTLAPVPQTGTPGPVLRPGTGSIIRPRRVVNLGVRGYITAVGGVDRPPGAANDNQQRVKEVYLPGVKVHLEDAGTRAKSKTAVTDLSGRFTLYAPKVGRYHLCWTSPVYGSGCDSRVISSDGQQPQFISSVRIPLPRRAGFVAVTGHVTTAEGSIARTFEPMLNINSFATVTLDLGRGRRPVQVYVNNYGDYLLPYVPVKQRVNLNAAIENARFAQEIRPEAKIESKALHVVNLRFENHRPTVDPLVVSDAASKRVQNATPGSTVFLEANGRDADGDPLSYAWLVGEGHGKVVQSNGRKMEWELPQAPGRYTAEVVAYDNKGGYSRGVAAVLSGAAGIPFTGVVVNPFGAPVPGAAIDIVGNPVVLTDGKGRFQTNVRQADRYVLNIRKQGFALNSRVYDRSITGGRWILRPAQVVTVNPTVDTPISHQRGERDCPGPDAVRAGRGPAGDSLNVPQWQDGKGNAIDPPSWYRGPRPIQLTKQPSRTTQPRPERGEPVILPSDLKLPGCGPGISVVLKANTILDRDGKPAVVPFQASISTIDVLSPQQMPGDDTVVPMGGTGAFLQSFGAGSLDLPEGFRLRPGATADISIPVDRARRGGSPLPPTMPLLAYDEQRGLWVEEGVLTLTGPPGAQAYTGSVKHFTTYNADTFFGTGAACVRVFSPTLPGQYDLEVIAPYPDGTPHYKKYPIDNVTSTEHVIYNLTPNMNLSVTPMTQGPNPNVLGFYIVNSGSPENPVSSPNPPPLTPQGYTSCNNFIVLKVGNAPDSPMGGEFLHGIGYIDAANLGFDDLTTAGPTGNALKDAVVNASRNYNTQVDPNNERDTFAAWKTKNGFDQDPNVTVSIPAPGAGEFVARYANSGDLGFGRDMHCLKKINGDVACYVTNYGNGYVNTPPGGGTPDQDDADAAGQRATVGGSAEVATVAMEYSPIENDAVADKVVKFYVYKKGLPSYGRSISANLDGRGERPVPQLCMVCHGGSIPSQSGGVGAFNTAAQVKLGARFVPFDHRFFTFPNAPAGLDRASQETAFKDLSEKIAAVAPPGPATDPIVELISGLYNGGVSGTQILNFDVPGWVNLASAAAPNQSAFYQNVLANACRTCHTSQPYSQLQFNTSDKFVNLNGLGANNRLMLGTAQLRVCGDYVMPHALRTHDIFWDNYWDVASWGAPPIPYRTQFQNFGNGLGGPTWGSTLCTSFLSPLPSTPSVFYTNSIQPTWNGKCVACHVAGGSAAFMSLVDGVSHTELLSGRVVPFNDDPAAAGNELLKRLAFTDSRDPSFNAASPQRMPQNCIVPPAVPGPGQLPCLQHFDIDRIKAWVRNGAN